MPKPELLKNAVQPKRSLPLTALMSELAGQTAQPDFEAELEADSPDFECEDADLISEFELSEGPLTDPNGRVLQMETLQFEIPKLALRQRVDTYLTARIKYATRNRVQHAIAEGRVTVNGRKIKNAYNLQKGDLLEMTLMRPPAADMQAEDIPLDIIYEDTALLILNKPPRIAVHPTYRNWSGTIANGLLYYLRQQAGDPEAQIKPGLVHRLDKDTSGVLVIGKTLAAKRQLARQFERRQTHKRYQALVWGHPQQKEGLIETNLGPSPRDRRIVYNFAYQGPRGKPARTGWKLIETIGPCALLEVELFTGRTHQIRAHLSHIGHPIVDDERYGGLREPALLQRQALHAFQLGFKHPLTGLEVSFQAPLPQDISELLQRLRTAQEAVSPS